MDVLIKMPHMFYPHMQLIFLIVLGVKSKQQIQKIQTNL